MLAGRIQPRFVEGAGKSQRKGRSPLAFANSALGSRRGVSSRGSSAGSARSFSSEFHIIGKLPSIDAAAGDQDVVGSGPQIVSLAARTWLPPATVSDPPWSLRMLFVSAAGAGGAPIARFFQH